MRLFQMNAQVKFKDGLGPTISDRVMAPLDLENAINFCCPDDNSSLLQLMETKFGMQLFHMNAQVKFEDGLGLTISVRVMAPLDLENAEIFVVRMIT